MIINKYSLYTYKSLDQSTEKGYSEKLILHVFWNEIGNKEGVTKYYHPD